MVNLANCCLLLLPCRITRLRRATYINPKFAKHKHVPQTHLGGTSRCFARQNCRAEHVNVPPGPLWRGWRCFAIIGLRIGVVSSGGPCAAVWRNGAGGGRSQNKKRSLAKWLNSVSAVRTRLENLQQHAAESCRKHYSTLIYCRCRYWNSRKNVTFL